MRGFLASSIGVVSATALALPLLAPQGAAAKTPGPERAPAAKSAAEPSVPGATQSLPLGPLASSDRAGGGGTGSGAQGLTRRTVRPFSLVGVVWDNPRAELDGTVRVRTRATGTDTWSGWQKVDTHNHEHAADPGTPESASARLRGATAPLWVGDSDAVEIRVEENPRPAARTPHTDHSTTADSSTMYDHSTTYDRSAVADHSAVADRTALAEAPASLPKGLRLELIDPGDDPAPPPAGQGPEADPPRGGALSAEAAASSAVNADLAPIGATAIPALTEEQTRRELAESRGEVLQAGATSGGSQAARPYIGPRPRIVTRKGWGADEKLREKDFVYTKSVRAAFVHHSATGNNYSCGQSPSILRSIYRYHVKSSGWRDFGYNFAVDKCGNIYEGRAGGVAKPVHGAHTLGFNSNSTGIAVLGTYSNANPPKAAVNAVARLTAWKLGLYGVNPRGKSLLTSAGSNLYKKGKKVRLDSISGHRDGFATECPGGRLYGKLGSARSSSAQLQGRG